MRGHRRTASVLAVLLIFTFTPAARAAVPATGAPSKAAPLEGGLPAGGPPVLYAPPPEAPQVQNHDGRFRAPYQLVSGTERYVDGEYLYTDFLYDDDAATYPADFGRYGNNAADLVEYRMSTRKSGLAIRLSLTTLLQPDSTVAVVAFNSDLDEGTGSPTLPRHPGLPFPGTDHVLTTWGTGAEWSSWDGARWETVGLLSRADLDANQITVIVPPSVVKPRGAWAATLAVGLFDRTTGGWLSIDSTHGADIVNLGFRFDAISPNTRPDSTQNAALSAGAPSRFAHILDFDLLHARTARDSVPTHGLLYRVFASRMEAVDVVTEPSIGNYVRTPVSEGKRRDSLGAQYLSRVQTYAVYVPTAYDPAAPSKLTFALHGLDADHFWINDTDQVIPQLGEQRNSLVLSPGARGRNGFYLNEMEYDVFEAWNDVARHYRLDPTRTAVTGLSMGGYGTYRLGLLYPHLFSRALAVIPASKSGIWIPGVTDDHTMVNAWLENGRNLPFFHLADMASETTFSPGQVQNVTGPAVAGYQSFDSLGYRYKLWAVGADHALMIIWYNFPETTEFLGDHQIEAEPFHVTYSRMPSSEAPRLGLLHNRAYWVSDIELRDDAVGDRPLTMLPPGIGPPATLPKGKVDAVSFGFGKSDPTSSIRHGAGFTGLFFPYVERERVWSEPGAVPAENRVVLTATNVRSLTIDPVAARVDCDVHLDIRSDGPIDVTVAGCDRRVVGP